MVICQGLEDSGGANEITKSSRKCGSKYPDQDEGLPKVDLLQENVIVQEEASRTKKACMNLLYHSLMCQKSCFLHLNTCVYLHIFQYLQIFLL